MDTSDAKIVTCRPSAWFFRKALQQAESVEDAIRIGRMAVDEMESLKVQIRELGEIPDRVYDPTLLIDDEDPRQQDLELEA